jgi:hypothetical protein
MAIGLTAIARELVTAQALLRVYPAQSVFAPFHYPTEFTQIDSIRRPNVIQGFHRD